MGFGVWGFVFEDQSLGCMSTVAVWANRHTETPEKKLAPEAVTVVPPLITPDWRETRHLLNCATRPLHARETSRTRLEGSISPGPLRGVDGK